MLVFGFRDDFEQTVGIVLRISTTKRDKHTLHLVFDLNRIVEHKRLSTDIILFARIHLRILLAGIQRIEHQVGLDDTLAIVFKIDNLRIRQYRAQTYHIVNGGRQDIVDEHGVFLPFADLKQLCNPIDRLQFVRRLAEHFRVCLVDVIVDIGFDIELVSKFQSPVNMADTPLVIAIHVDCHLLCIQRGSHTAQIGKGIDIHSFFLRHFKNVNFLAYPGLRRNHTTLRDNECTSLQITGRKILAIQTLFVVGHLLSILHAPG